MAQFKVGDRVLIVNVDDGAALKGFRVGEEHEIHMVDHEPSLFYMLIRPDGVTGWAGDRHLIPAPTKAQKLLDAADVLGTPNPRVRYLAEQLRFEAARLEAASAPKPPSLREAVDPDTLEAIADEIDCFEHSARAGSLRHLAKLQRAALSREEA